MNIQQLQDKVNKMDQQQHEEMILITLKRYQEQENAVFIDYDPLLLLSQIQHYRQLNIHKRMALAKNIDSIISIIGGQCLAKWLLMMAEDNSQIQGQLLAFIHQQVKTREIIVEEGVYEGYKKAAKIVLQTGELQMKLRACTVLSLIIQKLSPQQREEIILWAQQLINDQQDNMKTAGISLLKLTINYNTAGSVEDYFKYTLVGKYGQFSQSIRKEVINYCSVIAKHVSQTFFNEEVINGFLTQRLKEKGWSTRKSCAQILPALVQSSSMKHHLAELLLNLMEDSSKIVKLAAFKALPQFIAKYKDSDISDKLVSLYASSTDHEINKQANTQDQIIQKVVFYFPGVLATIGASKWEKVASLFSKCLFYKNIEIKLSICSSLHVICKLLGPQLAEDYIIKALNYFIFNQNCYEIKLKALQNITLIIQIFPASVRLNLIDIFMAIQQDSLIWRYKYAIAQQIEAFSKLYSSQDIYCYIFPIIFKLCSDSISQVRQTAADNIHHLLIAIQKKDKNLSQNAMKFVQTLAKHKEYHQRMIFCRIIRQLYKLPQFVHEIKECACKLAQDENVCVRISLSTVFNTILSEDGKDSLILFSQELQRLKKDEETEQYFE